MWQKAPSARVKALVTVAAGLSVIVGCAQFDQPTPRYWEIRQIAPPITAVEVAPHLGQPTFTQGGPPVFAGQPPNPRLPLAPLPTQIGGEPMNTGAFHHRNINRQYRLGATTQPVLTPSGSLGVAPQLPSAPPPPVFQPGPFQQITVDHERTAYGGLYPLMEEQRAPAFGVLGAQQLQQARIANERVSDQVNALQPNTLLPPNDPGNPLHQIPRRTGSVQLGPPAVYGAPPYTPVQHFPPTITVTGQPLVHGAPGLGTGMPMRPSGFAGHYAPARPTHQHPVPAFGFLDPARDPLRPEPILLDGVRPVDPIDPRMAPQQHYHAGHPHGLHSHGAHPHIMQHGVPVVGTIAGVPSPQPTVGAHDPLDAGATFRYPAQPAFGTMQGLLTAPQTGPGALGSSFIDPTTGHPRDFRHTILTPETMDPRNVNRKALDRLSAMSLRGYTVEKTVGNGTMRPPASNTTTGMTSARAAPYWQMIADDVADQMFLANPPGRDFYYIEPGTAFRNQVQDNIFRDMLTKALKQRGAQIAPEPEYATAFVRMKVDLFDLNPLARAGKLNPPDYTPVFRNSGHMMLVLDRGIVETRGRDLLPTNNPNLGYPSLSNVDPFVRPYTGIMASGLVEKRNKAAYRIHGAYYIDRTGI
ncbi:MAG: hypothetical protein KI792_08030 [Alphaproteobacteria bacterium]|nr:hypothetical protein [Alphaproteobacteria bacterium SS10]